MIQWGSKEIKQCIQQIKTIGANLIIVLINEIRWEDDDNIYYISNVFVFKWSKIWLTDITNAAAN